MNLIEQLGGYEKAKEWYKDQDLRGNHTVRVRQALLEYRRQHNIFEVGDWITSDNATYQILSIEYGDLYKVANNTYWEYGCFSHATDEEIKAGKRLEVK